MNTETGSHPYKFDADAFDTGRRHAEPTPAWPNGRYSLTASTGPAWIYWYEQGRGAAAK